MRERTLAQRSGAHTLVSTLVSGTSKKRTDHKLELARTGVGNPILLSEMLPSVLPSAVTFATAAVPPPSIPLAHWCHAIPKVELHAHLHGSIRPATLAELAKDLSLSPPDCLFTEEKTLAQCFVLFAFIHQVVTSVKVLRRIVQEVLQDFLEQNCAYLEIRTTPRCLPDGTDRAGYVRTLLEELEAFELAQQQQQQRRRMVVRALLSIDRGGSVEHAMEVARLAVQSAKESRFVVGMDFSGNPRRASFSDFKQVLGYARSEGLKITVHMAEVDNDAETDDVLLFRPERLGHALFLSDSHLATLKQRPIPIEVCPSSNLKTLELASHSQHPTLERLLQESYPFSINTDDCCVFTTTCSKEYQILGDEFGLTPSEVFGLARGAIEHIFEGEEVKAQLRHRFDSDLAILCSSSSSSCDGEDGETEGGTIATLGDNGGS